MCNFQGNDVEYLQIDLLDKEKTLNENIRDVAQLDEGLLLIDEQYNSLLTERNQIQESKQTKKIKDENYLLEIFDGMNLGKSSQTNEASIKPVPTSEAASTSTLSEKCLSPQTHSIHCAMRTLRQNIATQKAQIMKNLELNSCDKNQLDNDIAKLQQLQKQYVQYEKDVCYVDELPSRMEFCISDDGDFCSEDLLRAVNCDLNSNSSDGRDNRDKYLAIRSNETTSPININNGIINKSRLSNNCKCDVCCFRLLNEQY